jgi:chromosomal replication initiation ATPase DnaA
VVGVVAYSRFTEAGARRFVLDEGLTIARRKLSPRERVIALSRRWEEAKAASKHAKVEKAKAVLASSISTPKEVIAAIGALNGFTYDQMIGRSRNVRLVECRFDAVEEVYRRFHSHRCGLDRIGKQYFGGRDHTSILNALRKRGLK